MARDSMLALDPGVTTGFVLFDGTDIVEEGVLRNLPTNIVDLRRWEALLLWSTVVIYEGFRLFPGTMSDNQRWSFFPAVEIIGIIKADTLRHGIPCVEQSSAQGSSVTDAFLKQTGLWKLAMAGAHTGGHDYGHIRSAMRHLIIYLKRTDPQHPYLVGLTTGAV
jgi:hypothetical protein